MVHGLARRPQAFDALRWLLEAGYAGERQVVSTERCASAGVVLDLGCGTGALAGLFAPERYVGIDTDGAYLDRAARKHARHRFLRMDGSRLAFRSGVFDVVLIGGVIHHLDDPIAAAFLAEARRVLRPATGRLVLWEDVPTRSPWNVIGRLVHRLDEGDHIRPAQRYVDLVRTRFSAVRAYPMRSGVCDYVVVVGGDAP
jgi:SAM-dependent methyltransferase